MIDWQRQVDAATRLVRRHAGLTTAVGRDIAAAMKRVMTPEQRRHPERYVRLLESDAAVLDRLIEQFTVGETYFLREAEQLDFLRRIVIPDVVRRRGTGTIHAWSAGCASGEEAYTLALLFHGAGLGRRARVLGTDIARDRLRQAKGGHYRHWSFRGVDEATRARYFRASRTGYDIAPDIAESVDFRYLNLLDPDYAKAGVRVGDIDLILCRNVLIYLERDAVQRVAERLLEALAPHGWLLLGASDPYLAGLVPCEAIATGAGIIYRRPRCTDVRGDAGSASSAGSPLPPPPASSRARATVPETTAAADAATATPGSPAAAATPSGFGAAARVRQLADRGEAEAAARACAEALAQQPHAAELHCLHATLLLEAGQPMDAAAAARRAAYLAPDLALAHLAAASAYARLGRAQQARSELLVVERLLGAQDADATVPGAGDATAAELLELARAQLRLIDRGAIR